MKFLALIPARYASTRFPGKPLADLMGKPMIQHVYEKAHAVFDACYVATDDPRIEQAVLSFGGRVVMTSSEHPSGTDRCREALVEVERETGTAFDVVVNIQGDEPFVSREQLELIQQCFADSGTDIATLVKPFGPQEDVFNPNSPKVVVSAQGYALYFSRSVIPYRRGVEPQQWQEGFKYLKHIGMYAYRTGVLHRITDLPRGVLEQCESRLVIFSGPGIWEIGEKRYLCQVISFFCGSSELHRVTSLFCKFLPPCTIKMPFRVRRLPNCARSDVSSGSRRRCASKNWQTRYSNYPPASNRPFLNPHPMPNCRSNRQV